MITATKLAQKIILRMAAIEAEAALKGEAHAAAGPLWDAVLAEVREACPGLDYDIILVPGISKRFRTSERPHALAR
jgi:hypothetical protein